MKKSALDGRVFHFDNVFTEWRSFGHIQLFQIGEICCECGYDIAPHLQPCLEFSYIVSGQGYFYADEQRIFVQAGDLVCNSVGHIHAIKTDNNTMLRFMYFGFRFDEDTDEMWLQIRDALQAAPMLHSHDTHSIRIPFLRVIDEFYCQPPYSNLLIKTYLEEIILLAHRAFTSTLDQNTHYELPPLPSVGHTVYAVIRYVEEHLMDLKHTRAIAEALGYNYSYLSRIFRHKTGVTIQRYLNQKKVEKALDLLKFSNLSISEISALLQYETLQAFTKAFKRIMGAPPSRYATRSQSLAQSEDNPHHC